MSKVWGRRASIGEQFRFIAGILLTIGGTFIAIVGFFCVIFPTPDRQRYVVEGTSWLAYGILTMRDTEYWPFH